MLRPATQLVVAALLATLGTAQASVVVGGRTFADNAFADAVVLPSVSYLIWDGATANVETTSDSARAGVAALDTPLSQPTLSASTFAACAISQTEQACGTALILFVDNLIFNGGGADFTIFDINSASDIKVTINGVTVTRSTVLAGTTPRPPALGTTPWNLNAADFDLSDFGLASGATVNSIEVHWGLGETNATRAGLALIGATNSVPEPASLLLALLGVAGVAGASRIRRTTSQS